MRLSTFVGACALLLGAPALASAQAAQKFAQDNVIGSLLKPGAALSRPPFPLRFLDRFPRLRRIPGRLIGLGVLRERVRSPAV